MIAGSAVKSRFVAGVEKALGRRGRRRRTVGRTEVVRVRDTKNFVMGVKAAGRRSADRSSGCMVLLLYEMSEVVLEGGRCRG